MPANQALPPRLPTSPQKILFTIFGASLGLVLAVAVPLFWVYGLDTRHPNRDSIWWGERVHSLTPPGATDITLQRDFLDHYALYTVTEKDLNAFLDKRFADGGETLNSFAERDKPRASLVGKPIGPFDWVVTEDTVVYHYTMSNGATSTFYHDPTTGQTYQDSAHW
ncbi:MAG: hypothetical protein VYE77_00470 [Planctomycetota bacterium]|nr:hypothetical protein [Planctomycetota bacterium]